VTTPPAYRCHRRRAEIISAFDLRIYNRKEGYCHQDTKIIRQFGSKAPWCLGVLVAKEDFSGISGGAFLWVIVPLIFCL
jgi:hypothetical protein